VPGLPFYSYPLKGGDRKGGKEGGGEKDRCASNHMHLLKGRGEEEKKKKGGGKRRVKGRRHEKLQFFGLVFGKGRGGKEEEKKREKGGGLGVSRFSLRRRKRKKRKERRRKVIKCWLLRRASFLREGRTEREKKERVKRGRPTCEDAILFSQSEEGGRREERKIRPPLHPS